MLESYFMLCTVICVLTAKYVPQGPATSYVLKTCRGYQKNNQSTENWIPGLQFLKHRIPGLRIQYRDRNRQRNTVRVSITTSGLQTTKHEQITLLHNSTHSTQQDDYRCSDFKLHKSKHCMTIYSSILESDMATITTIFL